MWWVQEKQQWGNRVVNETLSLRARTVTKVWELVKKCGYQGEGGYARYLQVVAVYVLMVSGEVEGSVGTTPKADWWLEGQKQAQAMGIEVVQDTLDEDLDWDLGAESPTEQERVMDVVVDYMACTQSLRAAVPEGAISLPYDIQEWVYSSKMKKWVQNIQVDLMSLTGSQLWEKIQEDVAKMYGTQVQIGKIFLAMSPCCRTFSKADSSNVTRDNHYRLHDKDHPTKPPRDTTTRKGRMAHKADRMVKWAIRVVRYFVAKHGALFYMENPVGNLCRRPYMRGLEADGIRRVEVHYCAYGHHYMKPTHLWSNLSEEQWQPQGQTGSGKCQQRCKVGYLGAKGRWVHRYKIAQGSTQAKGGKGRKANKNMMPQALHEEILTAAGIRLRTRGGARSMIQDGGRGYWEMPGSRSRSH